MSRGRVTYDSRLSELEDPSDVLRSTKVKSEPDQESITLKPLDSPTQVDVQNVKPVVMKVERDVVRQRPPGDANTNMQPRLPLDNT